jgi:hypothetical protein
MEMDEPLETSEVARRLGVHPNTVKRIAPEDLPYFRVGGRGDRRYMARDVERYVQERAEGTPTMARHAVR